MKLVDVGLVTAKIWINPDHVVSVQELPEKMAPVDMKYVENDGAEVSQAYTQITLSTGHGIRVRKSFQQVVDALTGPEFRVNPPGPATWIYPTGRGHSAGPTRVAV